MESQSGLAVKNFIYSKTQDLDVSNYADLLSDSEWGLFIRNGAIFCDRDWYPRACALACSEDGSRIICFANNVVVPESPRVDDVLVHREFARELQIRGEGTPPDEIPNVSQGHFAAFMIRKDLYQRLSKNAPAKLDELVAAAQAQRCKVARVDSIYVYAPELMPMHSLGFGAPSDTSSALAIELGDMLRGKSCNETEQRLNEALARRQRIGILTLGFWPNQAGMEMMIHNLAQELTRAGDLVSVFTPKVTKPYEEIEHSYLLRRYKDENHLKAIFWDEHCSIPFDVLLVQGAYEAASLARAIAEPYGIPVVLRTHGEDIQIDRGANYGYRLQPDKNAVIEANVRSMDHNIVIGRHIEEEIRSIDPFASVSLIHNGVDTEFFCDNKSSYLRDRLGLGIDVKILLTVGRNVKKKSFHLAVDAIKLIAERDPKAVLVHVGKPGDGLDLKARARTLGVADRFFMLGPVDYFQMPLVYASADLFLFPSKTETFGNVTVEAMAAGLPCIEFDYSANREKIDNGVNGYVVPYGNVEALAECALELLRDFNKRTRFSREARRAVEQRFSWTSVAGKYREAFDSARRRKGLPIIASVCPVLPARLV